MKINQIIAVMAMSAMVAALPFSAEARKKEKDPKTPDKIEKAENVVKSKSQVLQERKPTTRAWGVGEAADQAFARSIAELEARRQYAATIGTIVDGAVKRSDDAVGQAAGTEKKTVRVNDETNTRTQYVQNIIDNIAVSGTVVINTDTYKTKNGQYRVYTCIEFMGDEMDLANDLAKEYAREIEKQVPDEVRADHDKRINEFKDEVQQQLERRRRAARIASSSEDEDL